MGIPLESQPWFEKYWQTGVIALGVIGVLLLIFYKPTP